jgi:hypothetical protein
LMDLARAMEAWIFRVWRDCNGYWNFLQAKAGDQPGCPRIRDTNRASTCSISPGCLTFRFLRGRDRQTHTRYKRCPRGPASPTPLDSSSGQRCPSYSRYCITTCPPRRCYCSRIGVVAPALIAVASGTPCGIDC